MLIALFLSAFSTGSNMNFEVVTVERTVKLEIDDHFLSSPGKVVNYQKTLFLLDNLSLELWAFPYEFEDRHFFFSGQGQGPGELNGLSIGIFPQADTLEVINSGGYRLERFDLNGTLIESVKLDSSYLYWDSHLQIISKSGELVFINKGQELAIDNFDPKKYGYTRHIVRLRNLWLIATETSNCNEIAFVVYDLDKHAITDKQTYPKIQKSKAEDIPYPIKAKIKARGDSLSHFFANNFYCIVTQDNWGYIFNEYSLTEYKHPDLGAYSTLQVYNPGTRQRHVVTIYHREIKALSLLLPLEGDEWLVFDQSANRFLFVLMRHL